MSGHSKWSTIKRKKEATDAVRGKLFSKLTRAIMIAVKTGGGVNPEVNYKLKTAIDAARSSNMPKGNIERALKKAESSGDILEVVYEALGPENVNIIIEAATDNKNRTFQEIRTILDRGGGHMASPGAVLYNFEKRGEISIKKSSSGEKQMLKLIDLGIEDIEETSDSIDIYTDPKLLSGVVKRIKDDGFEILSYELTLKPKALIPVNNISKAQKIINLLDKIEDQDDVQKVFVNADISDDILDTIDQ